MQLTIEELNLLNVKNDLRIDSNDLECFHHLLSHHWDEVMDESSLSLKTRPIMHTP